MCKRWDRVLRVIMELDEQTWQDMIDVNLTGVWKTVKAVIPHLIEQGEGGSLILTSSTAGLVSIPGASHYSAAKRGVVALCRSLSQELGPHSIRVNTVHPTGVDTDMVHNEPTYSQVAPDISSPSRQDIIPAFTALNRYLYRGLNQEILATQYYFLHQMRRDTLLAALSQWTVGALQSTRERRSICLSLFSTEDSYLSFRCSGPYRDQIGRGIK